MITQYAEKAFDKNQTQFHDLKKHTYTTLNKLGIKGNYSKPG